nr:hypothetical protein [Tanacetum cinerariifolium]
MFKGVFLLLQLEAKEFVDYKKLKLANLLLPVLNKKEDQFGKVGQKRINVVHTACVYYSYANARPMPEVENLAWLSKDWLTRTINWARFSATNGLGVIHRGHLEQRRSLMAPPYSIQMQRTSPNLFASI